MSFAGNYPRTSATTASGSSGGSNPLQILFEIQSRINHLQKVIHDSVNNNAVIGKDQMQMVSSELTTTIHHLISNNNALVAAIETQNIHEIVPSNTPNVIDGNELQDGDKCEILELSVADILAEYTDFCVVCHKGFKGDAKLRMHMRGHGDEFKTREALKSTELFEKQKRKVFACPIIGCSKNKQHKKFNPLKTFTCLKNHYIRIHCEKNLECTKCHKKRFSLIADLKTHVKHCGKSDCMCSCGTSFSRKDKLFGHLKVFKDHKPAEEMEVEDGNRMAEDGGASNEEMVEAWDESFENINFYDTPNASRIDDIFKS